MILEYVFCCHFIKDLTDGNAEPYIDLNNLPLIYPTNLEDPQAYYSIISPETIISAAKNQILLGQKFINIEIGSKQYVAIFEDINFAFHPIAYFKELRKSWKHSIDEKIFYCIRIDHFSSTELLLNVVKFCSNMLNIICSGSKVNYLLSNFSEKVGELLKQLFDFTCYYLRANPLLILDSLRTLLPSENLEAQIYKLDNININTDLKKFKNNLQTQVKSQSIACYNSLKGLSQNFEQNEENVINTSSGLAFVQCEDMILAISGRNERINGVDVDNTLVKTLMLLSAFFEQNVDLMLKYTISENEMWLDPIFNQQSSVDDCTIRVLPWYHCIDGKPAEITEVTSTLSIILFFTPINCKKLKIVSMFNFNGLKTVFDWYTQYSWRILPKCYSKMRHFCDPKNFNILESFDFSNVTNMKDNPLILINELTTSTILMDMNVWEKYEQFFTDLLNTVKCNERMLNSKIKNIEKIYLYPQISMLNLSPHYVGMINCCFIHYIDQIHNRMVYLDPVLLNPAKNRENAQFVLFMKNAIVAFISRAHKRNFINNNLYYSEQSSHFIFSCFRFIDNKDNSKSNIIDIAFGSSSSTSKDSVKKYELDSIQNLKGFEYIEIVTVHLATISFSNIYSHAYALFNRFAKEKL
eukprot:TRINITY_DN3618_c0_g1_i1.p1 TRINITY_DN3618_c0_g1~~TRINITY_DN3618_c0_g1_i1.p1  ORF type:complete len:638 (+),score=158.14 TRINITY_DN3618_c0_g1_i1:39-1952(+)